MTAHGWLADAPARLRKTVLTASRLRQLSVGALLFLLDDGPSGVTGLVSGRIWPMGC